MTDRPILFSAPMVQAILREIRNPGTGKTQTRRVLKPQPKFKDGANPDFSGWRAERYVGGLWHIVGGMGIGADRIKVPYMNGDRLWVRETWNAFDFSQDGDEAWPCKKIPTFEEIKEIMEEGCRVSPPQAVYRESERARKWFSDQKWRPGIHMPRWASRITLDVTDVRVQRLQEISVDDAIAEGRPKGGEFLSARRWFRTLWDSLNADRGFGWRENPWIVAINFRPHLCNIDQMEKAA